MSYREGTSRGVPLLQRAPDFDVQQGSYQSVQANQLYSRPLSLELREKLEMRLTGCSNTKSLGWRQLAITSLLKVKQIVILIFGPFQAWTCNTHAQTALMNPWELMREKLGT